MYVDGNFIQVLEGERDTVTQLYEKISRNQQHHSIIKLTDGYVQQRNFEDWSMAFRYLSKEEAEHILGIRNLSKDFFLKTMLEIGEHPVFTLLNTFYKMNYVNRFQFNS